MCLVLYLAFPRGNAQLEHLLLSLSSKTFKINCSQRNRANGVMPVAFSRKIKADTANWVVVPLEKSQPRSHSDTRNVSSFSYMARLSE